MKLAKWYLNLDTNRKTLFWIAAVGIAGFLLQTPLFFFRSADGYPGGAYALGWLLGSVISVISFYTMILMSNALLSSSTKGYTMGLSLGSAFLRILLYGAALVVSAICTFRAEWFSGFNAFNFYTTFGAMLPFPFVTLFFYFHEGRKATVVSSLPKTENAKVEEASQIKEEKGESSEIILSEDEKQ